jgi:hypothetical protein
VDGDARPANSWIEAGREILAAEGVSERERQFVEDMIRRFSNRAFDPSEKQASWFVSIYRRVVQAKAA